MAAFCLTQRQGFESMKKRLPYYAEPPLALYLPTMLLPTPATTYTLLNARLSKANPHAVAAAVKHAPRQAVARQSPRRNAHPHAPRPHGQVFPIWIIK